MRADGLILILLGAWIVIPLALQVFYVSRHGGMFAGGVSYQPQDLFQYLWWIRDSGLHGLISDPFQLTAPSQHVFLEPMSLISGVLWRLGLSLPLAFILPWAPISVVLTFVGFRAYVRRHISSRSGAAAALVLALFFFSAAPYLILGAGGSSGPLSVLDLDGSTALGLWGYFPRAIAVALLPLLLLRMERMVTVHRTKATSQSLWSLVAIAALGLTIAWLHPWQGAEVVIISVGFAAWSRPSRRTVLALLTPAAAALLPLAYYEILGRYDFFWRTAGAAQSHELAWRFSPQILVLAALPLCLPALLALRPRLPRDPHRRLLFLWVMACVISYGVVANETAHTLDGLVLPLSILAVQGWMRLDLAGRLRGRHVAVLPPVLALLAVAACTVPAAVDWLRSLHQTQASGQAFPNGDVDALHYLEAARAPGGVLAPMPIAYAVPSYTGRNVFADTSYWTPNHQVMTNIDSVLYFGAPSAAWSRTTVARMGARFLLAECGEPTLLPQRVAPLITATHRFGCATVYDLRAQPRDKLFPRS